MTATTSHSATGGLVPVAEPLFASGERQALATRNGLHLFAAKRVDIETFRGDMEIAG